MSQPKNIKDLQILFKSKLQRLQLYSKLKSFPTVVGQKKPIPPKHGMAVD